MFERLMTWLGFSLTEDLEQHKANADYAFDRLAEVEPELEAAKDRLSVVCADNEDLRARLRVVSGDELAAMRARSIRSVAAHG